MALGPIENWQEFLRRCLDQWGSKYLVSSPDVDGLVSAAIVAREKGAQLIGLYTTTHLLLFDDFTVDHALQALWLDQDINHTQIRCIGQHLISHHTEDRLPTRNPYCFNPNLFVCQAWENSFQGVRGQRRDKYPFGTCHMLLHAHDDNPNHFNDRELAILAHADGTILNRYRYETNCMIWKETMFGQSRLFELFLSEDFIQTGIVAEQQLLVRELQDAGISKRGSATKKRDVPAECNGLSGNQVVEFRNTGKQPAVKFLKKLNDVIAVIGNSTRFHLPAVSGIGQIVTGQVLEEKPRNIQSGDFDNWLRERRVFSHAFTAQGTLRCTLMDGTPLCE